MATTISEARDKVKERLTIGATTGEPTDAQIESFLRDAFRHLIAAFPVMRRSVVEIADGAATIPADSEVIFAGRGPKMLFASEWGQEDTTLVTLAQSVGDGDRVTLYYRAVPAIAIDATSVDTDSIFGKDWLEPAAIVMASLNAYQKLSNRSASRGGDKQQGMMRMMQEERKELTADLRLQVERFYQLMTKRQDERKESGDVPVVSRRRGLINESRIVNPLVEA